MINNDIIGLERKKQKYYLRTYFAANCKTHLLATFSKWSFNF